MLEIESIFGMSTVIRGSKTKMRGIKTGMMILDWSILC